MEVGSWIPEAPDAKVGARLHMVVQDRWRSEIVEGTVKAVESGKQSKQRLYYTEWNDGEAEHLDGVMVDLMTCSASKPDPSRSLLT